MKENEILTRLQERLGIDHLNDMQQAVNDRSREGGDMVLLSPTGTGKTIAYLLPVLQAIKGDNGTVQCAIIAPSRELVQQIDGVADDNSVESAIFSALKRVHLIDDISKCHYQRCGRTDAGVSAFNQVISLYLRSNLRSGVEFVDEFDPSIPYNAPNPSNPPQSTPSSNSVAEFDYASVETAFFFSRNRC